MKFSIWHYCIRFSPVLIIGAVISIFKVEKGKVLEVYGEVSFILLVALCIVGGFMGLLMAFGKLKMKCPFCGSYGRVNGSKNDGMWMECPQCGIVHGTGLLKLKLTAEGIEDDRP
mgnify:CR=1 FL=1|tara:strand:+ start:1975 stop:2319 length:345 start_codon:yes stop_codon:yes gene_type:complete